MTEKTTSSMQLILVVLIFCTAYANSSLTTTPKDTLVVRNQSTYFNCSTSNRNSEEVVWQHISLTFPQANDVYDENVIHILYADRFRIEKNLSTGTFNLIIVRAEPKDAGTYKCLDESGRSIGASAQLIVLDSDPICRSNIEAKKGLLLGENSCHMEPDDLQLSCEITYHGRLPPSQLEWSRRMSSSESQEVVVRACNQSSNCNLSIKASYSLNGSYFICRVKNSRLEALVWCRSDIVRIKYAVSSNLTTKVEVNEDVKCFAQSSVDCSYNWYSLNDTISSRSATLNIDKPGRYECRAKCNFSSENHPCEFLTMQAEVTAAASAAASGSKSKLNWLWILLLAAVLLIAAILFFCYKKGHLKCKKPTPNGKEEKEENGKKKKVPTATLR